MYSLNLEKLARATASSLMVTSLIVTTLSTSLTASADEPERGKAAHFEVQYLKNMIDHHFAALRVTELAAGTGQIRMAHITPEDRTNPTPGFAATEPHAQAPEIKSLSRRNNRMQREEILVAQDFLRKWYGITYEPTLMPDARENIEQLTRLEGVAFDKRFLESFTRHHYVAAEASLQCLVARELTHGDLRRYCQDIVNAQVSDIDEMRHLACERYEKCDIQPQKPMHRRHQDH